MTVFAGEDRQMILLARDEQNEDHEIMISESRHRELQEMVNNPQINLLGRRVSDDATGASWLLGQLAFVESEIVKRDFIPAQFRELVNVRTGLGVTVDSIIYQISENKGQAIEQDAESDTSPEAEVIFGSREINITRPLRFGYSWNVVELAQSAFLKKPLDATKADAALEGFDRAFNQYALFGRPDSATTKPIYPGLFTGKIDPSLTAGNFVTVITGSWDASTTTPLQILADLNKLIKAVWVASGYNVVPDTIILPTTVFGALSQPMTSAGTISTLEYLRNNNLAKNLKGVMLNFVAGVGLDDTSAFDSTTAANNRRVIAQVSGPQTAQFDVTVAPTWLAPQYDGLKVRIPGYARCSRGVKIMRPTRIAFMDGV